MTNNFFTKSQVPRLVGARATQINANLDLLVAAFDKLTDPDRFKERNVEYIADTGAADAYVVTYPQPVPDAYATGMTIKTAVSSANTGACTINVNNLGAKSILMADGSTPSAGVLATGRVHTLIYDGTAFRVQASVTTTTPDDATVTLAKLNSALTRLIELQNLSFSNGDLLYYNNGLQRLAIGSSGEALIYTGGLPGWGLIPGVDVQEFTASGTWNKPASGSHVVVFCVGGGGGGGSGYVNSAGTARAGGGGGGGGGFSHSVFAIGDLGSTETVTIGAGGAGGAANTTTAGNAGSAGGATTFGSHVGAGGGNGGAGFSSTANNGGTGGLGNAAYSQSEGGRGDDSASSNQHVDYTNGIEFNGQSLGTAGAGAGGVNSSNSACDGGDVIYLGGSGAETTVSGGVASGGNGTNGIQFSKLVGLGGTGGAGNEAGDGGAGGNGAQPGGGGGGSGGCVSGSTSPAGGDGGDGLCLAITY